jgi:hypothetical protein
LSFADGHAEVFKWYLTPDDRDVVNLQNAAYVSR